MKWLILLILFYSAYSQNNPCIDFSFESQKKLTDFFANNPHFEKPFYLSKNELFSIVAPEYLTYSTQKNELEVVIVKSNLFVDNKALDLSFGPFQMKLSFILETINNTPQKIINHPILLKLKKEKKFTSLVIDYLNKIETQWEILRFFEYCNKKNYAIYSLNGLYSIYNRGTINKKKNPFHKIECSNKSYEDWCKEFLNLLDQKIGKSK